MSRLQNACEIRSFLVPRLKNACEIRSLFFSSEEIGGKLLLARLLTLQAESARNQHFSRLALSEIQQCLVLLLDSWLGEKGVLLLDWRIVESQGQQEGKSGRHNLKRLLQGLHRRLLMSFFSSRFVWQRRLPIFVKLK